MPEAKVLRGVAPSFAHGGSGTVLAALAHGLALLCLRRGADQFVNALNLKRVGAGISLVGAKATQPEIPYRSIACCGPATTRLPPGRWPTRSPPCRLKAKWPEPSRGSARERLERPHRPEVERWLIPGRCPHWRTTTSSVRVPSIRSRRLPWAYRVTTTSDRLLARRGRGSNRPRTGHAGATGHDRTAHGGERRSAGYMTERLGVTLAMADANEHVRGVRNIASPVQRSARSSI